MAALLALLLASTGIERIELPFGGFARPGEWTLAVIHVRSGEAFSGHVDVRTDVGVRFRAAVKLAAGESVQVRIPFVTMGRKPEAVLLRDGTIVEKKKFPAAWRLLDTWDLLVAVDPAAEGKPPVLPLVWKLKDKTTACLFELPSSPPEESWLLEPVDIMIGGKPVGRGAWKMMGGVHWPTAENWKARLDEALKRRRSRMALVDENAWGLAPASAWSERKRDFLVLFSVIYAFAAFVSLFWVARKGGVPGLATATVLLTILFSIFGWLFFPSGRISVSSQGYDYRHSDGSGAAAHLLFVTTSTPGPSNLQLSRWVRPVFHNPRDAANSTLVIEYDPAGSSNIHWDAGEGDVFCLLSVEDATAPEVSLKAGSPEVEIRAGQALRDATVLVRQLNASFGRMAAGETRIRKVEEDGPAPRGDDFSFVRPRLYDTDIDNFLFARLEPRHGPGVESPDLLEYRRRGHFLIARFHP